MKFSQKQTKVNKAFLDLKRPFEAVKVYIAMAKLVDLKEDAIERGIGKLYTDGHLRPPEQKRPKKHRTGRAAPADDFR